MIIRWHSLLVAILASVLGLACTPRRAPAAVVALEITSRQPYAEGRSFGERGAYEQLRGRAQFAIDPTAEANQQIVDIDLAPRNAAGLVEFSADVQILAPRDLAQARGTLLYDVNNRGNPTCLGQFNGADEFLMRHGFIVVWSGWIAETLPGNGRMRLTAPTVTSGGQPVHGLVRAEMTPDAPAERLSIAHWANQGSYPPTADGERRATLTWRLREQDERVSIPRAQWRLTKRTVEADGQRGQLPLVEMELSGGFQPGFIYELIYEAEGALVQGAGLAGIRDLVSFLKHDKSDANPLRRADGMPAARRALGFGTSQSGRCLRMFLYDGFNADEQGERVFDGVMPHVAGAGLGFFNHRFASPTRHNGQHDNHLYPADVFPFAYADDADPLAGRTDGILRRARASDTVPKVMHTQSSSEYWHRSGSLVHTDPLGQRDAEIPPEVRIYTFGGCQHGPGDGLPRAAGHGQLPDNPSDYRPLLRALLLALDAWVRDDRDPPASVYPRLADGTLAGWREVESGWHALPGVRYPEIVQCPQYLDRGPDFFTLRRTTVQPPVNRGSYVVRVPAYGEDNNERGTLMLPSLRVPLATYTSWNLRQRAIGAESELLTLHGGYVPFAPTAAAREARGDPRPSIAERYRSQEDYRKQFMAAARRLVADRYLLEEDLARLESAAERLWALSIAQATQ